MILFTIGFTKQTAETFFGTLKSSGARRLVDVRLNNISQLSAFAKRDDLRYFLRELCQMDYIHRVDLAPTQEMFEAYKHEGQAWDDYAKLFLDLMVERKIEKTVPRDLLDHSVLLCSELKPEQCHRRLVAEYLAARWKNVEIRHL